MTLSKYCAPLFMFALACGQEGVETTPAHVPVEISNHDDTDCSIREIRKDADPSCEDTWICHSPGTKAHNQLCTSECMVPGDSRIYCWLKKCTPERRK